MSAIDFSKFPPTNTPNNVVPIQRFCAAQWVKDQFTAAFGVIQSRDTAGICQIQWSNGFVTAEYDTALVETTPGEFVDYLRSSAIENGWTKEQFDKLVPADLTLEALSSFETGLLCGVPATDDGAWATVEQTANELDAAGPSAEVEDIFAGFCDGGESVTTESPADTMPADVAERLCPGITESANNGMCALCGKVKTNRTSPTLADGRRICKRCQVTGVVASESGVGEVIDFFPGAEPEKPVDAVETQPSTTVEDTAETATGTCEISGADSKQTIEELVQELTDWKTAPAPKLQSEPSTSAQEISVGSATKEDDTLSTSVRTEAGLIDPETGELLEESFIMRKLGWTELPVITAKSTQDEIRSFEAKLDQVLDKVSSHLERVARYQGACEKRCAPYIAAAKFWEEQFLVPMSKMLAPYKLQKSSKGVYKGKTMVLDSGCIKFTKEGGAFVHEPELVKEYIGKSGVEMFNCVGAKYGVSYDHSKLLSALNKGVLKDIPGTGIRETNEFAKCKVVIPGGQHEQGESEDND